MSRNRAPVFVLLSLLGAAGCGGNPTNPMMTGGNPDMAIQVKPPDMAMRKPDMANLSEGPVGGPCMSEADCGGNRPVCLPSIDGFSYMNQMLILTAPNGYCSDEKCKSDDDCGPQGYCFGGGIDTCLGLCKAKGDCAAVNPDNVCINVMGGNSTCFPKAFLGMSCDPTKVDSCKDGGCLRSALAVIDDFGSCAATCKIGDSCPPAGNAPQACYFLNTQFDAMGMPTKDVFAGLVCLPDVSRGGGGPDAACMTLTACQAGYECNINMEGGAGKVCKKLCHNGGNECIIGTCQNAFKLANFAMDDIGLCL